MPVSVWSVVMYFPCGGGEALVALLGDIILAPSLLKVQMIMLVDLSSGNTAAGFFFFSRPEFFHPRVVESLLLLSSEAEER